MQDGQNARQQVAERIRQATSILVAVGNNPTVDALAASLGLSLMLNKLNKHATAVFSGVTPPAIQFLEPNKTFESNVDALRDFIISLDKEKADRLRYKVEDDVVRIFITPYKTSISEKDLQYSQGDFNVDLIIALGVEKREELDKAIVAHGRILHDATVVTVNASGQKSSLGAIDWNDAAASSLCEMLVGISEAFQQPGILDEQISTALLTGIVASTDRFSNTHTTPRVMTMAAQLMAAGANQQLIAINLDQAGAAASAAKPQTGGPMAKQEASAAPTPMPEVPAKKEPGELDITHTPKAEEPAPVPVAKAVPTAVEKELEEALPSAQVTHNMLPDLQKDLEAAVKKQQAEADGAVGAAAPGSQSVNDGKAAAEPTEPDEEYLSSHSSWKGKRLEPPTLGGVLNATTEEAMADTKKAEEEDRNKTLLTHPGEAPQGQRNNDGGRRGKGGNNDRQKPVEAAPAAASLQEPAPAPAPVEPVAAPLPEPTAEPVVETPALAPEPLPAPTAADLPPLPPMPAIPGLGQTAPAPAVAPEPEPIAAPAVEPTLAPAIEPAPVIEPAQNLDALNQEALQSAAEAAAIAQPVSSAAGELDSARQAVSDALDAQPFNPAGQPLTSVGAQPMPAMPNMPVAEPLTPAALQALPPAPLTPSVEPLPAPTAADLPPMPPMPPLPSSDMALPPAPDLPGLNDPMPPATPLAQPPAAPMPTASDPGQFKIPGA